jgi:hypothetical protein
VTSVEDVTLGSVTYYCSGEITVSYIAKIKKRLPYPIGQASEKERLFL